MRYASTLHEVFLWLLIIYRFGLQDSCHSEVWKWEEDEKIERTAEFDCVHEFMLNFGRREKRRNLFLPVQIEKMTAEDVPRVMELEVQCFPTPWHESAYLTEISNKSAYYIVAKSDGVVVGYSGLWIIMDEAHITTLGVNPKRRNMKIGEQLLVAMLDEVLDRGGRRVTLEVRESNEAARNLYRKYGFSPAAIRRGYYTDNGENAIVMWVSNIQTPEYRARLSRLQELLHRQSEARVAAWRES